MSTYTEYSFSWTTLGVLATTTILWFTLKHVIRSRYPAIYSELAYSGALKLPYWVADKNIFMWLMDFNYLNLNSKALTVLCVVVKLLWAASMYFIIAEPIYFEQITTP